MSIEIDTASSSADLLTRLNAFLVKGHTLTPHYTGTGTGLLAGAIGTAVSVQETITISSVRTVKSAAANRRRPATAVVARYPGAGAAKHRPAL